MTIEERVQRLEDDRAIRDLKANYLRACDSKDPHGIASTLLPDAHIAFEGFPEFHDRDAFIAVYRQFGCAPGIFDIHHGGNGVISFETGDRATGKWSLLFHNINLAARTLTQFGVEYDDVYLRTQEGWRIAATRSVRKSCLIHTVDEAGQALVTAMGEAPANFGES